MPDGEYHQPVHMTKAEAIKAGIIKPDPPRKPTLSDASSRSVDRPSRDVGYVRMPPRKLKKIFPKKKLPTKRGRGLTGRHKREHYLKRKEKEAVRGATGVLRHITATPEERAAAIKRKRKL